MVRWSGLRDARPDLAEAGVELFYQHGVGLAFLATVRADGGPRVHPMCPILHEERLFALLVPSPKRDDLMRDGRYSMHSFPADENEDAFYLSGRATVVDDPSLSAAIAETYLRERATLHLTEADIADDMSFEFDIATCLVTRTQGHGDSVPKHAVWHEPGVRRTPR